MEAELFSSLAAHTAPKGSLAADGHRLVDADANRAGIAGILPVEGRLDRVRADRHTAGTEAATSADEAHLKGVAPYPDGA